MPETLPAPETSPPTSQPMLPVIQGGLATTFITLGLLFLLSHNEIDINPMGWYLDYVLPAGAVLVGIAAGSGYGLMSWLRGIKIRRGLLIAVVVLQFGAYVAAEYLNYRDIVAKVTAAAAKDGDTIVPVGFLRYYQNRAENFAWKADHGDKPGEPLGKAGYIFMALAVIGFVGGGLLVPAACMRLPYCEGCERYMRNYRLGIIPASLPPKKIKGKDAAGHAAYDAEYDRVKAKSVEYIDKMHAAAAADDSAGFQQVATEAFGLPKPTGKLPARVQTRLIQCPGCERGWLRHIALTGQGKKIKSTPLDKTMVSANFANAVRGRPSAENSMADQRDVSKS